MINQLKQHLAKFQPMLGFDPLTVEQNSHDWHTMRLGVISASRACDLMADFQVAPLPDDCVIEKVNKETFIVTAGEFKGTEINVTTKAAAVAHVRSLVPPKPAQAYVGYMNELIGEICTQMPPEQVSAKMLEWGNMNEPKARDVYAFTNMVSVYEIPFVYRDESMRCGISPDGIVEDRGLEIKCPWTTKVHIDTLLNDAVKDMYFLQMQFSMYVTGAEKWDFCSFDPRISGKNGFKVITFERDEEVISKIDERVKLFASQMDEKLAQLGLKFGDQWKVEATPDYVEQQHDQEWQEYEQQQEFKPEEF